MLSPFRIGLIREISLIYEYLYCLLLLTDADNIHFILIKKIWGDVCTWTC